MTMTRRVALALTAVLASSTLVACNPPANKNQARKVGKESAPPSSPSSLANVEFVESERGGDPLVVGCADGQREGFADLAKFPTVAGCLGVWDGETSLRTPKSGKACGDDLDVCSTPADVCADGWQVCAGNGDYRDLSERLSADECRNGAGPGKFVAGISHVRRRGECPPPPGATTRYPCLESGFGSEAVCCGEGCKSGRCRDAVWAKGTRISVGKTEGCAKVTADNNGGVLCCKTPEPPESRPVPKTTARLPDDLGPRPPEPEEVDPAPDDNPSDEPDPPSPAP